VQNQWLTALTATGFDRLNVLHAADNRAWPLTMGVSTVALPLPAATLRRSPTHDRVWSIPGDLSLVRLDGTPTGRVVTPAHLAICASTAPPRQDKRADMR
jgi:hypothetical protein